MLKNKDILVFSDELRRHPFSCQHIMQHFFNDNRVLWVTPTGMRNPKFSMYDARRVVEKAKVWWNMRGATCQTESKLHTLTPFALPYNNMSIIRFANNEVVTFEVNRCMDKLGFNKPIVITTLPIVGDYINSFRESLIVYYCVDDFSQWPGVDRKFISIMEEKLIEKADIVMVTSDELAIIKERNNKRPLLIPHGVDYEHFTSDIDHDPCELTEIKRPIIGFFGAISPWIDLSLIVDIARAHPEWSIVLIGPVDVDVTNLKPYENIHLVGKVPYDVLPNYCRCFDIGIIPFLVNDLTVSVNPLKLLEYLASGLPVVSTELPEVKKFSPHVVTVNDSKGFISAIEIELEKNTNDLIAERRNIASKFSWKMIAEQMSNHIEASL